MSVTVGNVNYAGLYSDMVVKTVFSAGTSLSNNWVNMISGVKSSLNLAKFLAADDIFGNGDCDNTPTADVLYDELKLEVEKYGFVFEECYDIFVATLQEKFLKAGGTDEWETTLLNEVIEPILLKGAKEFGKAVWQGVKGGALSPSILNVFDGFEKRIVDAGVVANQFENTALITGANAFTILDEFIDNIISLDNSDDILYPGGLTSNEEFPAIWVDYKMWSYLNKGIYASGADANFSVDKQNPFTGTFKGYVIRVDQLSTDTLIAGKKSNLHFGYDGNFNGRDLRIEEIANKDKVQIVYKDRAGTLVTSADQVAISTIFTV